MQELQISKNTNKLVKNVNLKLWAWIFYKQGSQLPMDESMQNRFFFLVCGVAIEIVEYIFSMVVYT